MVLLMLKGTATKYIPELHARYNSTVVRYSPNQLSFIDPAAVQDIYGYQHGKRVNMTKDGQFYGKAPDESFNLLNSNEDDHSRMRRNVSHAFSEKALVEQQGILTKYIDLLITRLRERVGEPKLDMVAWYNRTTFDVIGEPPASVL